ncbi:MAG: hypothetical protein NT165_02455 [Candidatus Falkowbacteria bacterium]|nr:hypothetical protein [Candidatus Falkowbacteria bacterium]
MNEILENSVEQKKYRQEILACILDEEAISPYDQVNLDFIKERGDNLDWDAGAEVHLENNMKNAGQGSYIISEGNEKDKFSLGYGDCLGFAMVGKDAEGKEISLMSHKKPENAFGPKKEEFENDLSERINDFLSKVDKDTVDAVIFGGHRGGNKYKESIKTMGAILQERIGFEPTVMTGPNLALSMTDAYLDTKNRRLYIVRGEQDNSRLNEDFLPSQIDEKSKTWFGQ